jgi:Fic family protein
MSKDQDKATVLQALKEQNAPISLPELIKVLGHDYPDRTVRRWLTEWIKKGIILKQGEKRGTRYLAVKENLTEPTDRYFSQASQKIISQIKAPYDLRKPVTYQPTWLNEYRPNKDFYLSSTQRAELEETGSRAKKYKTAGTYARHIYNRLLVDLSYNSSRLEGNTYSLLETEKLINEGTANPNKPDEEKTMILNHKEAIRFLVDNCEQPNIDETTIYTLHYLLSDGLVAPEYAGKVRDYGVQIRGSTYIPLENPTLLKKYLKDIQNKANQIKNPFEKSIFLLAHIAYLQSFVDVNKRTSRLIANFPLFNANLVPLSFDAIEKNSYIDAMIAIYELNDIKPLIDLYLFSYRHTAEKYDVTVEAIGFDRVRVQYRQQRREIVRHIVTEKLHGVEMNKYIKLMSNRLSGSNDQKQFIRNIHEDLEQLGPQSIIGMGITIKQVEGWKKKRV